jgi:hypothetical protein
VLADEGGGFEVELIQGYDAVDAVVAGDAHDGRENLDGRAILGHGEEVGDGVAGPIAMLELVDGEEENFDAEGGGFLEEGLAFFVGTDAEDRGLQRRLLRLFPIPSAIVP